MNINMPPLGVIQHMYDIGSQDPFIARMMFQMFQLRDQLLLSENERKEFDDLYDPILQNLIEARFVKERAIKIIEEHKEKVESGQVATFDGKTITVNEFINTDLNIWFKDFYIRGRIATERIKYLAKIFDYDLSFIFSDEEKFREGKRALIEKKQQGITEYLLDLIEDHRNQWYRLFSETRRKIEHQGFKLPEIKYSLTDEKTVRVHFPRVDNMDILDLLELLWENLFVLCEDTVVLMMSSKVRDPLGIRHIPESQRNPQMPVRYVVDIMPQENLKKISYRELREK